jgi:hypothetical protein
VQYEYLLNIIDQKSCVLRDGRKPSQLAEHIIKLKTFAYVEIVILRNLLFEIAGALDYISSKLGRCCCQLYWSEGCQSTAASRLFSCISVLIIFNLNNRTQPKLALTSR